MGCETSINMPYVELDMIHFKCKEKIKTKYLWLHSSNLTSLPAEIGNLVKLQCLSLNSNLLTSLPVETGNLVNLKELYLNNNKLTSLPVEILNIKMSLCLDETSFQINNISFDTEILIFSILNNNLDNLPITLKTLYLHKDIDLTKHTIKLPFSCVIERY